MKSCKYCGKKPEVRTMYLTSRRRQTPYVYIECVNEMCKKKPTTNLYKTFQKAHNDWEYMMMWKEVANNGTG